MIVYGESGRLPKEVGVAYFKLLYHYWKLSIGSSGGLL
jgi:hypothetical protein